MMTLKKQQWRWRHLFVVPWIMALSGTAVLAAPPVTGSSIPGPADVGRVKPDDNLLAPLPGAEAPLVFPETAPDLPIPQGASTITFVLHQVVLKGVTAFSQEDLSDIYAPYLDTEITLETAYKIAAEITRHYRNEGYFLSITTLPDQKIADGTLTLQVTEGYIGDVDLSNTDAQYYVVSQYIDRLKAEKPLKAASLESFLLQLNDMPGWSYRAVLSPLAQGDPGAIKLTLVPAEKAGTGFVSFDNFNSRYLGPHEGTASYSVSLIPHQQTTVSTVNSFPWERLHYGSVTQSIPVFSDINLVLSGSKTKVKPGFTLEPLEIKSESNTLSAGFDYQALRQRQENLTLSLKLDSRDTTSDTLGTRITDDNIRALRAGINFDLTDNWQGYSAAQIELSQGIDGLGSSKAGELNLSRANAKPDFTKLELSLSRLQQLSTDWLGVVRGTAQLSSGTLYSAEQYGYGGQQFGRAFDSSELIGDQGASGALELRYSGFSDLEPISLQPFGFYDFGVVTTKEAGSVIRQTGSSIGAGLRFSTPWNESGSLSAAYPLIRNEATPIYGFSDHGPRISFQFTQGF